MRENLAAQKYLPLQYLSIVWKEMCTHRVHTFQKRATNHRNVKGVILNSVICSRYF